MLSRGPLRPNLHKHRMVGYSLASTTSVASERYVHDMDSTNEPCQMMKTQFERALAASRPAATTRVTGGRCNAPPVRRRTKNTNRCLLWGPTRTRQMSKFKSARRAKADFDQGRYRPVWMQAPDLRPRGPWRGSHRPRCAACRTGCRAR